MEMIFKNELQLANAITSHFPERAIIGIDGWTSAGKTSLAKRLAEITSGSKYDLDAALIADQCRYVDAIKLDEVRNAISSSNGILFLSGICLREILHRVGCPATAYIYVKRMAIWGWADEDEVNGTGLPEIRRSGGEGVRGEMRAYHKLWEPHLNADFEFHRRD